MIRDFKGVWIPKEIWVDESLTWTEKILLVEIDSLSELGQCFASNEHFSKFLGLSKDRVTKVLSSLKEKGYAESQLIYKTGTKEVEKRVITTVGYRRKCLEGIGENNYTPIGENAEDNNTISFTNTITNTKDNIICIFEYYNSIGLVNHRQLTKAMENAIKKAMRDNKYTVEDCKILLDRHKHVVDVTKELQYSVRKRSLDEFFGQKVHGGLALICSEYEDGGAKWESYKDKKISRGGEVAKSTDWNDRFGIKIDDICGSSE